MNPYKVIEVRVPNQSPLGITYNVTVNYEILVCPVYTRHKNLQEHSTFSESQMAWGGILTETGHWVRGSLDFGDCHDSAEKEFVLSLIRKHFKL